MRTSRLILLLPSLVALVWTLGACGSPAPTGPRATLAQAQGQERWFRERPHSYRMTVSRFCECLPEWVGPVVVTVGSFIVVDRRYAQTGAVVLPQNERYFPDIQGLFTVIDQARVDGAAVIDVRYNRVYGYPEEIRIDFDGVAGNDDEVQYLVRNFEPLEG